MCAMRQALLVVATLLFVQNASCNFLRKAAGGSASDSRFLISIDEPEPTAGPLVTQAADTNTTDVATDADSVAATNETLPVDSLETFINQQAAMKVALMARMEESLRLWGERVKAADAEAMAGKQALEEATKNATNASKDIKEEMEAAKRELAQAATLHRSSVEEAVAAVRPAGNATAPQLPAPGVSLHALLESAQAHTRRVEERRGEERAAAEKQKNAIIFAERSGESSRGVRMSAVASVGRAVEITRAKLADATALLNASETEFVRQSVLSQRAVRDAMAAQRTGRTQAEVAAAVASAQHQATATKQLAKLAAAREKHVTFLSGLLSYLQSVYDAWAIRVADSRPFTDDSMPKVSTAAKDAATDAAEDKGRLDQLLLQHITELYGVNSAIVQMLNAVNTAQSQAQAAVNAANAARADFEHSLAEKLGRLNGTEIAAEACDPDSAWYDAEDCCCNDEKHQRRQDANYDIDAASVVSSSSAKSAGGDSAAQAPTKQVDGTASNSGGQADTTSGGAYAGPGVAPAPGTSVDAIIVGNAPPADASAPAADAPPTAQQGQATTLGPIQGDLGLFSQSPEVQQSAKQADDAIAAAQQSLQSAQSSLANSAQAFRFAKVSSSDRKVHQEPSIYSRFSSLEVRTKSDAEGSDRSENGLRLLRVGSDLGADADTSEAPLTDAIFAMALQVGKLHLAAGEDQTADPKVLEKRVVPMSPADASRDAADSHTVRSTMPVLDRGNPRPASAGAFKDTTPSKGVTPRFISAVTAAHDSLALKDVLASISMAASKALGDPPASPSAGTSVVEASPHPAAGCPCPSTSATPEPKVVAAGSSADAGEPPVKACPCPTAPPATQAPAVASSPSAEHAKLQADCKAAGYQAGLEAANATLSKELTKTLCEALGAEVAAAIARAAQSVTPAIGSETKPAENPVAGGAQPGPAAFLELTGNSAMLVSQMGRSAKADMANRRTVDRLWTPVAASLHSAFDSLMNALSSSKAVRSSASTSEKHSRFASLRAGDDNGEGPGGDGQAVPPAPAVAPAGESPATAGTAPAQAPDTAAAPSQAQPETPIHNTTAEAGSTSSVNGTSGEAAPTSESNQNSTSTVPTVTVNQPVTNSTAPAQQSTNSTAASTAPVPSPSAFPSPFPSLAPLPARKSAVSSEVLYEDIHVERRGEGRGGGDCTGDCTYTVTVVKHLATEADKAIDDVARGDKVHTAQPVDINDVIRNVISSPGGKHGAVGFDRPVMHDANGKSYVVVASTADNEDREAHHNNADENIETKEGVHDDVTSTDGSHVVMTSKSGETIIVNKQ